MKVTTALFEVLLVVILVLLSVVVGVPRVSVRRGRERRP
jgi:hypothetical protein